MVISKPSCYWWWWKVILFGRRWLQHIRLNWAAIKAVRKGDLSGVLEQNAAVFNQELGELKAYHFGLRSV